MQAPASSVNVSGPKFTHSVNGDLVNGYIDYVDQRKTRRILFKEEQGRFWMYTVTVDKNDIVMAAKSIQWCLTNLLTYDPTRVHVCKYIFNMYREGKVLMFLPTPYEVPHVLVNALANSPVLPVHVMQWSGELDSLSGEQFRNTIESIPLHVPSTAAVEHMHDLNRPPADKLISVSSEVMDMLKHDYSQCAFDQQHAWKCWISCPWLNLQSGGLMVVYDGFEFVESVTAIPIQTDASLDTMEYLMSERNASSNPLNSLNPLKPSVKMRMKRLNRKS